METYDFSHIRLGFIGFGLIGGSIARALKKRFPSCHITVFSRSQEPLLLAQKDGNADTITTAVDESFSACDIIFLCTPVEYNALYLDKLKNLIRPGCILTDAGSVKGHIHQMVHELDMEDVFIGGHPMAGSEKTGYANSDAALLKDALYVLTPTPSTTSQALNKYAALVECMGAVPVVLDPQLHDRSVAGISHLPHLIAASLVELVEHSDDSAQTMRRLAAGGFKDITRIASSSAEVWKQICLTNSKAICALLGEYIAALTKLHGQLNAGDEQAIHDLFEHSKKYRDTF